MNTQTQESIWDPIKAEIKLEKIACRIKHATFQRGWQEAVRVVLRKGIPINQLKVAEVGCGEGTMSLIFGLLGASVTLLDFNEKVLERTKRVYDLCNCQAKFIKADCLDAVPTQMIESFDMVVSMGLAEHFTGENREKCFAYHRFLLKKGGIVVIGVPNSSSLFYRWIRFIREFSGTWKIDIEQPFTARELKNLAQKVGFQEPYVIGYVSFWRDFIDHVYGLRSAVIDIFPERFGNVLRKWKEDKKTIRVRLNNSEGIVAHCRKMVSLIENTGGKRQRLGFNDKYNSGLVLFAIK